MTCMVLLLVLNCAFYLTSRRARAKRSGFPRREILSTTPPHLTGRDLIHLPTGSCVIFQIPPIGPGNQPLDDPQSWIPSTTRGAVEIYQERPGSYWYRSIDHRRCIPTLNCVSYVFGPYAGFTVNDYVACDASPATNHRNPTQQLLEAFCGHQKTFSELEWSFARPPFAWRNGDIVCYYNSGSQRFLHLCLVDTSQQEIRLVGKIGAGPVIRTSIETLNQIYQGRYDEVQIYRPNKHQR
jgi:hypothetical protein